MRDFKIITDSCSDISQDVREKYGIECVKANSVVDGNEFPSSVDWEVYSAREYYDLMRNGKRITTTQVPTSVFAKTFTDCVTQGYDALYIGCSSALSGSINTATVIAKEIMANNTDCKIRCVDSLNASGAMTLMAIKAAELRAQGKSIDEVEEWLVQNRLKYNQIGAIENLEYLRRAGRVKATAAFFGNLFGVKPIIISDAHGNNYAVKKVKGRKGSFAELVNMLKETIVEPEEQTLILNHADCLEDAEKLANTIKEVVGCKEVKIGYIGPIIGASVGPGTVGIYYLGKEVTIVSE